MSFWNSLVRKEKIKKKIILLNCRIESVMIRRLDINWDSSRDNLKKSALIEAWKGYFPPFKEVMKDRLRT